MRIVRCMIDLQLYKSYLFLPYFSCYVLAGQSPDVRRHFCSQSIFDQRRLGKKVLKLISNECLIISIVAFLINKVPSHHELLLA